MKKKIGSMLLSLSILLGCIPAGAAAVQYKVLPIEGDTLEIEAEAAETEVNAPWERMDDDPDASEGGYVKGTGSWNMNQRREDPGGLRFHISVKKQDRYQIWMRYKVPDANANSYYFRVDDANWSITWPEINEEWQWVNKGVELFTEGEHVIELEPRAPYFCVDKLVITSVPENAFRIRFFCRSTEKNRSFTIIFPPSHRRRSIRGYC